MNYMSIVRRQAALRCRWFSSTSDLLRGVFFNRTAELEKLRKLLTVAGVGHAGKIVVLTGPRDSGKTALLREFYSRQSAGIYDGVPAFVDMRVKHNTDPSAFAINLASSFARSLRLKVEADAKALGGSWELDVSEERISLKTPGTTMDFKNNKDPMGMVMDALEGYMSSLPKHLSGYYSGFPTIFIDEANVLTSWTNTPEGTANLDDLLRFFVRISKQENAANVVLASSENFFRQWLCGRTPLRGHDVRIATVGHLNKEDAREFVTTSLKDVWQKREGLEDEALALWDDVYAHYGGALLRLGEFVSMAALAKPGEIAKEWEEQKLHVMETERTFVKSGFRPDLISEVLCAERMESPRWTGKDWSKVVAAMAAAQDGVVSESSLSVEGVALASMIRFDLLHYRVHSGWDRDISVPPGEWPIVMPVSKAQHLVMKEMAMKERAEEKEQTSK